MAKFLSKKILLIPLIACFLIAFFPIRKNVTNPVATASVVPAAPMESETVYSQKFRSPLESIYEIDIPMVTYQKINRSGTLKITLSSGDITLAEKIVDVSSIPDNSTYQFAFDRIPATPDREFTLSLRYEDYTLAFYSGETDDPEIYFNIKGQKMSYIYNVWWILLIIVSTGLLLMATRTKKKGNHEKH